MAKSLYAILGVAPDATPEEIKGAYRQRAKEVHPDCTGQDCALFRAVREAYEVLGDAQRRRAYDDELAHQARARAMYSRVEAEPLRLRRAPVESLVPHGPSPVVGRPWGAFSSMFDAMWDQLRKDPGPATEPALWPGEQVRVQVVLTPEQARRGGEARLRISVHGSCPACGGSGREGTYLCRACYGEGTMPGEHVVSFHYPPGTTDRHGLMVPFGRPGAQDMLVVHFRVEG